MTALSGATPGALYGDGSGEVTGRGRLGRSDVRSHPSRRLRRNRRPGRYGRRTKTYRCSKTAYEHLAGTTPSIPAFTPAEHQPTGLSRGY